jgi:beta-phosphoglucomutase
MANDFGVIFDVDGVLVDSYRAHLESWRRVAADHDLTMTDADFARTFGRTSRDIIQHLWPGRFDDAGVLAFDAQKESLYRELLRDHFPEMAGAGDLIAALHEAGFRLAIGSSGPPENVALVKRKIPHGQWITATINGTDVKHGKPDPEVFLIAAQRLGLDPSRCAVVEDAPAGLQAARRAGMIAIGLTGTAPRETLALHAHLVVDRLSELTPEIFRQWLSRPG